MGRVLWYKFLRWLDSSSSRSIWKALVRLLLAATVAATTFVPSVVLGYLRAVLEWNSYRIPIFCLALACAFNARRIVRKIRSFSFSFKRRSTANQHSYRGLPIAELANFLHETKSFKRDEAIRRLGLSQGQYWKIAEELESKGVLFKDRTQGNARALRAIGREQLVRQLRDGFPLVHDPVRDIWVERDGSFVDFVLNREFEQRRVDEKTERAERKLKRVRRMAAEEAAALPSPKHSFASA